MTYSKKNKPFLTINTTKPHVRVLKGFERLNRNALQVVPVDDHPEADEREIAVLHDEAYFEFSGLTAKDLIDKYDNLYITRTFAKAFGLVSARVGHVISQEDNIQELLKIRGPYDVNMFAKVAVLAALDDLGHTEDYVKEVMGKSKPKLEEFLKEKGISFYPSSANFLFLKVNNAQEIIEKLKFKGILVRPKVGPDDIEGVRVSIGNLENTEHFIKVFDEVTRG